MKRLQSLSYKTLFIILFFSLAGIVFFLKIGGKTTKVSAAWWDEMWHYRKAISIDNTSGSNLTDFQVSISIGTSALIASGKMQTDCDDIRITDINGNLLPYWIEENNPGCNQVTDTKIWFKANSLPTSGATIYIYYGNQQANNSENGDGVFEFFDDFSKDLNKWINVTNSSWFISNEILNITPPSLGNYLVANKSIGSSGIVIESQIKSSSGSNHPGLIWHANTLTSSGHRNDQLYLRPHSYNTASNIQPAYFNGSLVTFSSTTGLFNSGMWHNIKIEIPSSDSIKYYRNDVNEANFANQQYQSNTYTGIAAHDGTNMQFDNFRVRKYASTKPSPSLQSEETSTAPIAYWKFDEGVGSTTLDSSGNSNTGTINSSTWASEDQCISGKCLSFDGISKVTTISSNLSLKPSNITVSLWVKTNEDTSVQPWNGIIQGSGGDGYSQGWRLIDNTNKPGYQMNFGDGSPKTMYGLPMGVGKWNHIVLTYDHQYMRIYQNGVQVGTPIAETRDINWGSSGDSLIGYAQYYFNGLIDEVKIYPYARTADQIKQDYNSRGSMSGAGINLGVRSNTTPSIKSSLIAHYKFDEGEGTTAYNSGVGGSAFNSIFGTGNSAPTWTNNGKTNKALSFDGVKSYLRTPTLSGISQASWSVWVKPNTTSSMHVIKSNAASDYLIANINGKAFRIRTFTGSGDIHTTSGVLPTDKWSQLTMVYYNPGIKLYLNGKLENQNIGYSMGNLNGTYNIGLFGGAEPVFNGLIDEVKIYNRALTDEEVKQDYNAGSAIQFGQTNQTIGGTTTSLDYCIPGDTSYCAPPVAEWNFEENTGTVAKDISGNNNTGTINNTTWTVGKKNTGAGLNFSGSSQYITIEDSTSLKPTTNVTVEAWFNTTNKTLNQRMVSKTNGGGYSLSVNENSACPANTLCFLININGSYYSASYPSSNLSNNTWYHAAGSYDGTTVRLFLNGSNIGTTASISNTITQNTAKLCIGSESAATNCYAENGFFSGKIDDVRIYNYARTPAQIAYDYNKGAPIGWWKLDECQGNIVNDSSGIGNTGVIVIGSSGSQNSIGTCQIGTSAAWTNGASGKINSSLNFDGTDDYISIPDSPSLTTPEITIAAWVKSNNNGDPYQRIVDKTYNQEYAFFLGSTGTIGVSLVTNTSSIDSSLLPNAITDTNWHHIAFSWSAATKKVTVYVDGVAKTNTTLNGDRIADSNNPLIIGDRVGLDRSFNGQLDDVRIYNYALTNEQIKQVYNGGAINFQ